MSTAATALADDSGSGLLWPDPNEPYYWDANENAQGTGPAPLPTDDLYWKEGENAGGTATRHSLTFRNTPIWVPTPAPTSAGVNAAECARRDSNP